MDSIIAARGSDATMPPDDAVVPRRDDAALAPGTVIPSHYRLCFGCGSDHDSGLQLRVSAGPGLSVAGTFAVGEFHQGAPGLAHGGVLASAVDEVMGALNWLLMEPAVTARLEVDFVRPVPVGATVELTAAIAGQSGRKVYSIADGRVDGRPVLHARGLFLQVPLAHFADNGRRDDVARAAQDDTSPRRPWLEINP